MREIGRTAENERIVALTERETRVLRELEDAIAGLPCDWFQNTYDLRTLTEKDLAPIFGMIWIWAKSKFKVNELRGIVDELEKILEGGDELEKILAGSSEDE